MINLCSHDLYVYPLKYLLFCVLPLIVARSTVYAQDSLSLDDIPNERVPLKEAFNGPHIIYSQSTNMLQAKRLDLVFGHRFGRINEGAFNAWGLDQSFIRIGAEYGITDWITIGMGRSSLGKNFDLFLKNRPIVQTTGGSKNIPVSVTLLLSGAYSSNELRRQKEIHGGDQFIYQLVYTSQVTISRQFLPKFALQVSGTLVHRNSVPYTIFANDVFGMSAGTRLKLTERMHLMAEYNHVLAKPKGVYNPAAIGLDIVAGGHVFNVHIANAVGIIEKEFITATTDKFPRGMRLGFTIRRSFMLQPNVEGGKVKY